MASRLGVIRVSPINSFHLCHYFATFKYLIFRTWPTLGATLPKVDGALVLPQEHRRAGVPKRALLPKNLAVSNAVKMGT